MAVPQLVEDCFDEILRKATAIDDPFEQAFFALVQLPHLKPFLDVNKRVSRLAANLPLIRANLCPLSFVDVPINAYVDGLLGVYELNRIDLLRDVFCWAYERSCARYSVVRQSLGEPDPFRQRHRELVVELIRRVVAAARGTDDGDGLALTGDEVDVLEHRLLRVVGEADPSQFDALDTCPATVGGEAPEASILGLPTGCRTRDPATLDPCPLRPDHLPIVSEGIRHPTGVTVRSISPSLSHWTAGSQKLPVTT